MYITEHHVAFIIFIIFPPLVYAYYYLLISINNLITGSALLYHCDIWNSLILLTQ